MIALLWCMIFVKNIDAHTSSQIIRSEPLRRSLQDGHAYVRKTGVMGILKMYHLNKEEFDKAAFNDILYDMLRDPDSSVVWVIWSIWDNWRG